MYAATPDNLIADGVTELTHAAVVDKTDPSHDMARYIIFADDAHYVQRAETR
jgi:hypothetical protein